MNLITDPTLIPLNMRVEVYWNLHRHCYSVRALQGPSKGRVIAHLPEVNLTDVQFVVQTAGRERVRRERRKTVHAFVRGRWTQTVPNIIRLAVTYNPYRHDTFVDGMDFEPIHEARYAVGTILEGRPSLSII